MDVVIYLRVSTKDGRQTTVNQRLELEKFIKRHEWNLVHVYEDHESGQTADRPDFKRMFTDAERGKFDMLLFWSLDRFTREGSLPTLKHLERLDQCGVKWKSYSEEYLETCSIHGPAIVALIAGIAKQERVRLSERTHRWTGAFQRQRASGTKRLLPKRSTGSWV